MKLPSPVLGSGKNRRKSTAITRAAKGNHSTNYPANSEGIRAAQNVKTGVPKLRPTAPAQNARSTGGSACVSVP